MSKADKILLLTILILFQTVSAVLGQSATIESQLKKVYEAYLNAEYLALDIEVMGYPREKDSNSFVLGDGKIRKQGNMYYSYYDGVESITNEKLSIMVDHTRKTISLFEEEKTLKEEYSLAQAPDFDAMLAKGNGAKVETLPNGNKKYTFTSQIDYVEKTEIEINKQSDLFENITYHYVQPDEESDFEFEKVNIHYSSAKSEEQTSEYFDLGKFVIKTSKGYRLTTPFSGYTLTFSDSQNRLSP